MIKIQIFIPAAGASLRMRGQDKLLKTVKGQPLLLRVVSESVETDSQVCIGLPKGAKERIETLKKTKAQLIEISDCSEGMSASLRAGCEVAENGNASALLIVLADMPEIETGDLMQFISAHQQHPERVFRGTTSDGRLGHPVLIPARLFPKLRPLRGDQGAKAVLEGNDVTPIVLEGERAVIDLDTPEDWARWRARREGA